MYVCDAVLPSLCTIFIVTNSKYGDTNRMSHKHFLNKKNRRRPITDETQSHNYIHTYVLLSIFSIFVSLKILSHSFCRRRRRRCILFSFLFSSSCYIFFEKV